MRRRVSGATPILKVEDVKEVTVRQVPLTAIESPRVQSPRMEAQSLIVIVVPPPDVSSWGSSSDTAARCVSDLSVFWYIMDSVGGEGGLTAECFDNSSKHYGDVCAFAVGERWNEQSSSCGFE